MNESTQNRKITFLSLGILAVLLIACFVCWAATDPQALEPVKEITVKVAHSSGYLEELEYSSSPEEAAAHDPYILEFETTAKTFLEALEPHASLLEFMEWTDETGETVSVIYSANGEILEPDWNYAWFCYRNGEEPVDSLYDLPIEDGDSFYFYIAEKQ